MIVHKPCAEKSCVPLFVAVLSNNVFCILCCVSVLTVTVSHVKGEQRFTWRLSTPPSSKEPIFRWRVRCSFPAQNLNYFDALSPSARFYEPFSNPLLKQAFSGDAVMTAQVLVRLTVRAVSSNYVGNWSEPVEASLHKPGKFLPIALLHARF